MIRVKNNLKKSMYLMSMDNFKSKKLGITLIAASLMCSVSTSAFADISNEAKATGTYNSGTIDSDPSTVNVPVAPASSDLNLVVSVETAPTIALGDEDDFSDGGDTIVYRFTVTNNGNVTEENIVISNYVPTFDGNAGLGTVTTPTVDTGDAASLAVGSSVEFVATYTMNDKDGDAAAGVTDGVVNSAKVASVLVTTPEEADTTATSTLGTLVAKLNIAKTYAFVEDNGVTPTQAAKNDKILYTYTVENTGNVAITNVSISDTHEGSVLTGLQLPADETITSDGVNLDSDVGTTDDGTIDVFGAGAIATFTYEHTVTQPEVDAQ